MGADTEYCLVIFRYKDINGKEQKYSWDYCDPSNLPSGFFGNDSDYMKQHDLMKWELMEMVDDFKELLDFEIIYNGKTSEDIEKEIIYDIQTADHYSECGYLNWRDFLSDCYMNELYTEVIFDMEEEEIEDIWDEAQEKKRTKGIS